MLNKIPVADCKRIRLNSGRPSWIANLSPGPDWSRDQAEHLSAGSFHTATDLSQSKENLSIPPGIKDAFQLKMTTLGGFEL